jgi:hypothetical protein
VESQIGCQSGVSWGRETESELANAAQYANTNTQGNLLSKPFRPSLLDARLHIVTASLKFPEFIYLQSNKHT